MTVSSKRAEYLSLMSLVLSIIFFLITYLLSRWSGYFAMEAVSWLAGSAVLIWIVLLIQFHQHARAEQEKLDSGELASKGQPSIFEKGGEQAQLLNIEQKRLAVLEKYFIPIFSGLIAVYQLGMGLFLLERLLNGKTQLQKLQHTNEPLICAVALGSIFFVGLLISRYATGLSSEPKWRPLKAGGAITIGVSVISLALAVILAFVFYNLLVVVLTIFCYLVPVLMIILGCETSLNVILDIYRPRVKGVYGRAAFDSRLLGIINEPGGILHTAAAAIDYQFGFKVSQTWFYRMLEKAIVPLILFGAASVYLLSCIVVVGPDEQAVVEHFGAVVKDGGTVKIYQPGIIFKWPWPIDKANIYPTNRIMELSIGYVPEIDPATGYPVRGPKLWDRAHYKEEFQLLVATKQAGGEGKADERAMKIILAAIPVQFKVNDLYSFLYNYGLYERPDGSTGFQAERMLEAICYRELARFAASSTIDVNSTSDFELSLLGAGRISAKDELTKAIQKSADNARLGVQIVFVGMQGIHPPIELAADYQKVVGAIQQKQAIIFGAESQGNMTLTILAGSIEKAKKIYDLQVALQTEQTKGTGESARVKELTAQIDRAFNDADGKIFAKLSDAKIYAYEKATIARANGERFVGQVAAYRAAPEIYKRWKILAALETSLKNVRKYVLIADKDQYIIQDLDATEKLLTGLTDVSGYGEK